MATGPHRHAIFSFSQRDFMSQINDISPWLILVTISALLVGGCKKNGEQLANPLRWTEDVRLPDGRIVTLTRYQEFKGPHEINNPPSESDYWLEFTNPDNGQKVRWSREGQIHLRTVALLIKNGTPFLLTAPGIGNAWEYYKCPNPAYVLFSFKTEWREVPIESIPFKTFRANMTRDTLSMRSSIQKSNHLTADTTSNSFINGRPYILDFANIAGTSYEWPNCRPSKMSFSVQD